MSKIGKDYLILRALRCKQADEVDVFSFFVPGNLIVQIADISRIRNDNSNQLHGFQRKEIKNHVNSIVEYLDQIKIIFPNAIILAFSKEIAFKKARGRDPKGLTDIAEIGTISIPIRKEGERVAWIVDGQQRSLALAKTKNKDIPVPVVAFVAPDIETQRAQFILVNKAKPLPTQLINELLPEVDTHMPRDLALRKIPSEICNLLQRDPNSPFYNLIKRSSNLENDKGVVIDTVLIEIIKKSINNPLGILSQYKGFGDEPSDINGMYRTLVMYWNEVKNVFKDAWGLPPTKSRLMHSAGIKVMGTLMDRIMSRVQSSKEPIIETRRSIEKIAPFCRWTSGTWEGIGMKWDEIQNIHKHIRLLTDYLLKIDYNARSGDQ